MNKLTLPSDLNTNARVRAAARALRFPLCPVLTSGLPSPGRTLLTLLCPPGPRHLPLPGPGAEMETDGRFSWVSGEDPVGSWKWMSQARFKGQEPQGL